MLLSVRLWPICALLLWSAAAAGAAELSERHERPIGPGGPEARLFQTAVLHYVNVERARAGLRPLADDPRLTRVAVEQAADMAAAHTMSHRVPNGGRLVDRLEAKGVVYRRAGENIAMEKALQLIGRPISARTAGACAFTYADTGAPVPRHSPASLAAAAVRRWMASKGHRANLLDPGFRRMGAGAAVDPAGAACGDVYLAQTFAG